MPMNRSPKDIPVLPLKAPAGKPVTSSSPEGSSRALEAAWSRLAEGRHALQADELETASDAAATVLRILEDAQAGLTQPTHDPEILAAEGCAETLLGSAMAEQGESGEATSAYLRAVTAFEDGGSDIQRGLVSYAAGVALLGAGRPADAEQAFRRGFDQGEDTPDLRRGLALALARQERLEEAYRTLLDTAPRAFYDWRARVLTAEMADELEKSEAERARCWADAAKSLSDAGRTEQALRAFHRVVTLMPSPDSTYALAFAQARAGRPEAALETLGALAGDARSPQSQMLTAEVLLALGKTEQAVAASRAAVDQAPPDAGLLDRHASVLAAADRFEELLVVAEHLAELNVSSATRFRGQAELGLGRPEEAIKTLLPDTGDTPEAAVIHGLLAQAYSFTGENQSAVRHLDQALRLDPEYIWARASRGILLALQGEGERARDELLNLLDRYPDYALAHAYLGQLLSDAGEQRAGLEHLRTAVELSPASDWMWIALAQSERDVDTAAAETAYDRALALDGRSLPALAGLAELLMDRSEAADLSRAQELLATAADVEPDSARVHALLGECLRRQGRFEPALTHLDRALELDPGYGYALATRGQTLLAAGERPRQAIADLKEATAQAPDSLWMRYTLADAYLADDELAQADAEYKILGKQDAKNAHPWLVRADIRIRQGRRDEAESMLRQAVRRDPDSQDARNALADHLYDTGRSRESLALSEQTLSRDPQDERARFLRAAALADLGSFAQAREELEQLVSSPVWGVSAARTLGEMFRLLGRFDDARHWLDHALAAEPDSAWTLGSKGAVLRLTGDLAGAEQTLRRALEIDGRSVFAAGQLAGLLLTTGRNDDAIELYQHLLADGEQDADVLVAQAAVLRDSGRIDEALVALDQALWIRPEHQEGLRCLGWVLTLAGRREEALDCFRRAVRLADADRNTVDIISHVEFAEMLLESGDVTEAWVQARRAVTRAPDRPQAWNAVSLVVAATGAWAAAAAAATRAAGCDGQLPESYRALGWATEHASRLDRAEAALSAYDAALRLDHGDLWALKGRANALLALGHDDRARADYETVLAAVRGRSVMDGPSLSLEGWCLLQLGRYREAARALQASFSHDERISSTMFDLVLVALAAGQPSQASGYARRGLQEVAQDGLPLQRGALSVAVHDLQVALPGLPPATKDAAASYLQDLQAALARVEADPRYLQFQETMTTDLTELTEAAVPSPQLSGPR